MDNLLSMTIQPRIKRDVVNAILDENLLLMVMQQVVDGLLWSLALLGYHGIATCDEDIVVVVYRSSSEGRWTIIVVGPIMGRNVAMCNGAMMGNNLLWLLVELVCDGLAVGDCYCRW